MNYIKIMGGLGNQLFEYTFAKYLEQKSGNSSVLYTDHYNTAHETRLLSLDKFCCDYIDIRGTLLCSSMILEHELPEDLKIDRTFFAGYWQDKKYYNEMKELILEELTLKQEYISEDIRNKATAIMDCPDSVAMHIRRGDYLEGINTQVFVSQTMDYYRKALQRIRDILGCRPTVYVFSDDYDYISTHLPSELAESDANQIIPIKPGKDYEDLYLMSFATHHVIANSSFSWWGAALSKKDGITVMPGQWFKDREDPELDIEGWIKI